MSLHCKCRIFSALTRRRSFESVNFMVNNTMVQRWLSIVLAALALQQLLGVSRGERVENINILRRQRESIDLFKRRRPHARNIPDSSVCQTNECKAMANMIMKAMKNSTDPCEDFYEYACGGWAIGETLPRSEAVWNMKGMLKLPLEKRLVGILENGARLDDIAPVKMAKRWYRSCMDLETLEERGIQSLQSLITTVGGWPIAMEPGEWNSREFSWQQVEKYYSRFTGSYILYSINVPPKSQNCLYCNELTMAQPKLPLSEYLPYPRRRVDPEDVEAYSRLIARVVYTFVQDNRAHIARYRIIKDVRDMVDFEIALSRIFPLLDNYVLISVNDIQKAYDMEKRKSDTSKLEFGKLIQNFLDIGNVRMHSSQLVNFQYEYIRDLITLLDETPARTIVNYIHWHFVSRTMSFTNQKMRDLLVGYTMEVFGIQEERSRSSQCLKEMQMHHALAFEYARKHFSKRLKNDAMDVVRMVKRGLGTQISESNWMSEDLKFDSKEKAKSMRVLIGYPDWYSNTTAIIKYYEGILVGPDYFDNNLNHWRFAAKKKLEAWKGTDPNAINGWVIDPLADSPAYIDVANEINVPLMNFQSPLFTPELPEVVNYAIAGFVIAEQMAHGFDGTGRFFDKHGNVTEWSEKMSEAYDKSAECFVEQFDAYPITNRDSGNSTEVTQIGNKTLDENIADSVGIRAAFFAYKSAILPKDSTDRKLPGLEKYTKEQLFFLISANTMCEVATPELLAKRITDDPRSPARLRAIGAMSNSDAFARAFECRIGRPMNPANKCSIWQNAAEKNAERVWFNPKIDTI